MPARNRGSHTAQLQTNRNDAGTDIDEIEAILNPCDREQERNLFQYAFCTGMRPSGYIAQERANVSFVTHQLEVTGALVDGEAKRGPKTAAGLRLVHMRQGALECLKAQQAHTKLWGGTIFLNPTYDAQ